MWSQSDAVGAAEEARERSAFLDAQARLPGSRHAVGARSDERRDYPELAPLVGLGREGYRQLSPPEQRLARLEIDRELALRRNVRPPPGDPAADGGPLRPGGQPRSAAKADPAGEQHPGLPDRARHTAPLREESVAESSVMRDAREVAAGRKRQLGLNRP
jgi:hypothetical protein